MKRTRKKLDIGRIKGVVMFFVGALTGAGGAVTGLGTQVAAAPEIDFLLGFTPERTAGTAAVFALFAAAAGIIGASLGGLRADTGLAILFAISATIGALAVVNPAAKANLAVARRT